MPQAARAIAVAAAALILLAAAAKLQAYRERAYPAPPREPDAVYLTSGTAVRRLSGAFNALAADVYWIRAIQYYGGTKRRLDASRDAAPAAGTPQTADYSQLYAMLDIVTSLDPRFNIAYRFGAVFLAETYPAGPGRPDLAIRLLEKGLRERPDKWEYMEDIGFVHYWYRRDYREATAWFTKASEVPGSPWWLRSLAATTLASGGDRGSSRQMWEAIRQSAEIDWLRQEAERRLAQLRALDEIDALQPVVDQFAEAAGHRPADFTAIARARRWPGVPADPTGTPYEIDANGRVVVSQKSRLWPMPAPESLPSAGAAKH